MSRTTGDPVAQFAPHRALAAYGVRVHEALGDEGFACSPLGAYVLLAAAALAGVGLVAPVAHLALVQSLGAPLAGVWCGVWCRIDRAVTLAGAVRRGAVGDVDPGDPSLGMGVAARDA